LAQALEGRDPDVAWLAAEALRKFKKAAWPVLLRTLITQPEYSDALRQGVHYVFRTQQEEGFNDLLKLLLKALEAETVPEMVPVAARNLLERMNARAEDDDHRTPRTRRQARHEAS
jgi:hypothetical protein